MVSTSTSMCDLLTLSPVTVLVIEAGPLDKGEEMVVVPRQAGGAMRSIYDWNFTSIAMPQMANRSVVIPAGKVVGGSSVLNGMCFDRGAAADYNAWGELGNPGWSFTEILPFFKKVSKTLECRTVTNGYSRPRNSLLPPSDWRSW
jgi:choline dehydrogenase-like flavoprotein